MLLENDDNEEVTNTHQRDNMTPNKHQRKKAKINKAEKLETCMTQWSSTICMRNDEFEFRTYSWKKSLHTSMENHLSIRR